MLKQRALYQSNLFLAAASAAALSLGSPAADAALLVEESFNIGSGSGEYVDGESLQGKPATGPATNGWNAAWTVTGTTDSISEAGGLTYSAGTIGTIGGTGGSQGNAVGTADTRRNIASNTTLQTATTLWARVLFQSAGNDGFFSFRTNSTTVGSNDGRVTFRHVPGTNADILLQELDGTKDDDPTPGFESQVVTGTPHLLLFKFDIDRTGTVAETVSFWLDPTTSVEANLGTATATVSGNILDGSNTQLNQFDFTGGDSNFKIDEIAIGADFSDVVPIPEPASLALMGLGGLLMLGRRRGGDSPA